MTLSLTTQVYLFVYKTNKIQFKDGLWNKIRHPHPPPPKKNR